MFLCNCSTEEIKNPSRVLNPHLAKIHYNTLMDLLPQVSTEDLDQGDLQGGNFAVHEDARQVKLHLKTNVHLETGEQEAT